MIKKAGLILGMVLGVAFFSIPFRNGLLLPVTWLEQLTPILEAPSNSEPCQMNLAAHRSNSQKGKYLDHGHEGIQNAIDQGVASMEIDVKILNNRIVLAHDDIRADSISLAEFATTYMQRFKTIIVDIKETKHDDEQAIALIDASGILDHGNVMFIGRRCALLRDIEQQFGKPSGCELHGTLGNYLLGLSVYSQDYRQLTSLQASMVKMLGMKLLLWTFDTPDDAQAWCGLHPEISLVSIWEN